jgi:hypothetical protein
MSQLADCLPYDSNPLQCTGPCFAELGKPLLLGRTKDGRRYDVLK